jgi:TetR/AcrR family acrAB operon transcriptional repressor
MVRKTKEEALATRSGILDAAELVFQKQGVSRTSLHDIAQAAGVTRGAVYWHFKDKADLFGAMMDRACLPIEEATEAAHAVPAERAMATLRVQLLKVFKLTATDERARRVFEIATQKVEYVDELSAVRERHLQSRRDHVAHIEELVRSAQKHGLVGSTPARSIALGLHAIVDGMIQNWLLDPAAFDLVRTGTQVVDVYLNGLRCPART